MLLLASYKFNVGDRVNVPKRYFNKSDLPVEKQDVWDEITCFTGTITSKGLHVARVQYDTDQTFGSVCYSDLSPAVAHNSSNIPDVQLEAVQSCDIDRPPQVLS